MQKQLELWEEVDGRGKVILRKFALGSGFGACRFKDLGAPKDTFAPILGTCEYVTLCGKKDFADVVKVTDLEMRLFFLIIWVGPNLHLSLRTGSWETVPAVLRER